ncbi:MAG: hypothetical protein ACRDTF_09240 [Pseudonocardiaceae bacterium]
MRGVRRLTIVLPGRAVISAEARMTAIVVTGAVCGGLLGVAALSFKALGGTYLLTNIVLDGASGFLWLAAGTVAHIRHPANRVGLLMVAVGIGWFVEDLQLSRMPVVFSVGLLLTAASSGFLVHLVLAFPAGRLASRLQRLLAAAAYLTALAAVPFAALFSDRRPMGLGHPPNLLLVRYDPQLVDTLWWTIQAVGVVVAVGVVMVEWEGRRVAALVHDEALREDPHVLQAVAAAVAGDRGPRAPARRAEARSRRRSATACPAHRQRRRPRRGARGAA